MVWKAIGTEPGTQWASSAQYILLFLTLNANVNDYSIIYTAVYYFEAKLQNHWPGRNARDYLWLLKFETRGT